MTISLNPQQDNLFIPVKLYKEFTENLVKTYTDEKLKNEVKIEESKISSVKQKINELNEDAKKLKDDLPDVIFHKDWNQKFNSEKESGEKLFEFLKKNELNELEAKTKQEYEKRKTLFLNIAKAAKAAVDEGINALKAYKVLNEATDAANNAAAAPATGTAGAAPASNATQPKTLTSENINKSFILTKKLYEAGFIDRSEYLAGLVKTKKLLEATPAASTAASTAAPSADSAKARQEFGTLIANIGNKDSKMAGYLENLGLLQDQATKMGQGRINENKRKLIKNLIKKRILEEAIKQENQKEYLNEFLLLAGLLAAAAAAIGAWIGKKFAEYFSKGPAVIYKPDSRNTESDTDPDEDDMGMMFDEGGVDAATGQVLSKDGLKPLNPEEQKKAIQEYIKYINDVATLYAENLQKLTTTLPACNYDPTNKTAIENALKAIPKTLEQGKAIIPALNAYLNS